MKKRSIEEISNACGGEIRNCDLIQNVSIFVNNDKEIVENCVYVAIKGEKYDGFDFAQSAISKGACAVLCDKNTCSDLPCIAVDNVLDALQDIARYFREKELKNVVAVTGSYGKTTVKELCASVLGQKSQVLKTKGNKNNLIGLPLTVLSNTDNDVAVLEAGISEIGEMEKLSRVCAPDIAIITGIGLMHGETLGDKEGIAGEKMKITSFASKDTVLILPENEPLLADSKVKNKIFVGVNSESADYSACNIKLKENGTFFDVLKRGKPYIHNLFVPIIGSFAAYDATLAVAVGDICALNEEQIRDGLIQYKNAKNRQNIITKNGFVIIDDCYNFGPESAYAALEVLDILSKNKTGYKTVLCLGSMLELGQISEKEHIALGKKVAEYRFDTLITLGEQAKNIALGAYTGGMDASDIFAYGENERSEMSKRISELESGSIVLLKGSRKMKMEEFIPYIG